MSENAATTGSCPAAEPAPEKSIAKVNTKLQPAQADNHPPEANGHPDLLLNDLVSAPSQRGQKNPACHNSF